MTSRSFSKDNLPFTYQTRIKGNEDALSAYAKLFGVRFAAPSVRRRMLCRNPTASLKSDYIRRYGIPARVFNAIKVTLEGRMSGATESQKLHRQTLEGLIARAEKQHVALVGRATPQKLHQKRRRIANLKHRLRNVSADTDSGRLRLCFGSKKLWRSQHHLEANGYRSHTEWLDDWQEARSNEFFVLGSRDETAGCQLCVADRCR